MFDCSVIRDIKWLNCNWYPTLACNLSFPSYPAWKLSNSELGRILLTISYTKRKKGVISTLKVESLVELKLDRGFRVIDTNILQLLGIPGRIYLVPPVTQLFWSKWLHFFHFSEQFFWGWNNKLQGYSHGLIKNPLESKTNKCKNNLMASNSEIVNRASAGSADSSCFLRTLQGEVISVGRRFLRLVSCQQRECRGCIRVHCTRIILLHKITKTMSFKIYHWVTDNLKQCSSYGQV